MTRYSAGVIAGDEKSWRVRIGWIKLRHTMQGCRLSQIFVFALALLSACRADATLVLVIPNAEGALIAADSRLSLRKRHVDGIEKIRTVPNHGSMAFALTGYSEFYPVVTDYTTERELRHIFVSGPRNFSGQEVVLKFLTAQAPGTVLDHDLLDVLGI